MPARTRPPAGCLPARSAFAAGASRPPHDPGASVPRLSSPRHTPRFSVRHPTSIQKCSNNNNYQDIQVATISAIFNQHSTSLHDARNRTFTLTYESDDHSCRVRVEHAAPSTRHARIALRMPGYAAEPPLGRPRCQCSTHARFAGATPTNLKLRRAESVRSAAPRAASRVTLRPGCHAHETPPLRARSPRGTPHHFAVTTPTILRRAAAERVRSAAPRITLRLLRLRLSLVAAGC